MKHFPPECGHQPSSNRTGNNLSETRHKPESTKCALLFVLVLSCWPTFLKRNGLTEEVTVPVNTSATVYVPATSPDRVAESGVAASRAAGVRFLRMEGGEAVFRVGSGTYRFAVK